jgi:hypothetical protein
MESLVRLVTDGVRIVRPGVFRCRRDSPWRSGFDPGNRLIWSGYCGSAVRCGGSSYALDGWSRSREPGQTLTFRNTPVSSSGLLNCRRASVSTVAQGGLATRRRLTTCPTEQYSRNPKPAGKPAAARIGRPTIFEKSPRPAKIFNCSSTEQRSRNRKPAGKPAAARIGRPTARRNPGLVVHPRLVCGEGALCHQEVPVLQVRFLPAKTERGVKLKRLPQSGVLPGGLWPSKTRDPAPASSRSTLSR